METKEWLKSIRFELAEHRNLKVICCYFPYGLKLKELFKSEFPSASWSRNMTCWYLPDNTLFRKRCGIPLPEIGQSKEQHMFSENRLAYEKFRNALTQKAFSKNTIATYLNEFSQLLILLKNKPVSSLTSEQLNSYFLYCIKKLNHSENQVFSRMNAVKSYFKLVEQRAEVFDTVIRPKPQNSLPKVLSKEEISRLLSQTENVKHLLMLKMAYGMGLRVSELVNLKVEHIDSDRLQVHVVSSKGKKDRYVNFPKSLTNLYSDYLKAYQPEIYLFEGQFGGMYTTRSVQAVFKNAMRKAGINKSVGIHGLRHSYATHLLEVGTDMVFIQKLLGHNHIKTTEIYAKVSRKTLGSVQSPLDTI